MDKLAPGPMKVFLIRHGTARGNLERCFVGVTDSPLIPEGIRLAQFAAKTAPPADCIYVSPLSRCRVTAEIIWPKTGKIVIGQLRETDFGPFEGKSHKELSGDPLYEAWLQNPGGPETAGLVESHGACAERAAAGWGAVLHHARQSRYGNIAVVSHGGVLMHLLSQYAVPGRGYYDWKMGNCCGYLAETGETGMKMRILSEFRPAAHSF